MKKNYNYERQKLQLPEYGRHIQNMVNSLMEIEDRDDRNRQAKAVIAVMGNLNPLLRDTPDYTHKLWDHLFIISDFKLDVDSLYPCPTREDLMSVEPEKMEYPQEQIEFKHYGKYVANMVVEIAKEGSTPEDVDRSIEVIARYMRVKGYEYNQEHPNNEAIIKDIRKMSKCSLDFDEDSINNIHSNYKGDQNNHSNQKNQKGQKGVKGQKNAKMQRGATPANQSAKGQGNQNFQRQNQQNRNFVKKKNHIRNNN